jgi:hypothetical protein
MSERTWPCSTLGCERIATMLLTLEMLTDPIEAPRFICLCDHCAGGPAGPGLVAAAQGLLGSAVPASDP